MAAFLAVGAWGATSQHINWRHFGGFAAVIATGLFALQGWKNSPVGQLVWDGQVWRWEGRGYQASVAEYELFVTIDFQSLMLLRIENQAHAKLWLWAERRAFPARWLDFRRAVYSPHRSLDSLVRPA